MSNFADDETGGMLLVEAVEALKASWISGESSIGSIGSQVKGRTRTQTLLQLVLMDSELAIKSQQPCEAESYVKLFPELETDHSVIQAHIAKVRAKFSSENENVSAGLFSKASLDRTLDHLPVEKPSNKTPGVDALDSATESETPKSISNYRILGELGRGSFGQVFLAEDSRLGRKVAIKIQDRRNTEFGLSDAFLHEARAIARLEHPHIVRLLHVDETTEGLGYLVYEYVTGSTLADRVKHANYSLDEAVRWITEIAGALDFAHRRGVVHRDISPRNIMIDESGTARLLDFGLSRLDDRFHVDDEDRILGTPNFMSPEQASGKPHWATSYSDLFSLGSVLYHAITRKLPFTGSSIFDICERVQSSTPPPPRSLRQDISPELELVVSRAMAKEPQARYSTGVDFAVALTKAVNASKKKGDVSPPVARSTRLLRVVAIAMVTIGIATLGWAWHKYEEESLRLRPAPELTSIRVDVERGGVKVGNLLSDKGAEILPLQPDDVFTFEWQSTEKLQDVVTPSILVFGSEQSQRIVFNPQSSSKTLRPKDLFSTQTLIVLCLATEKLSVELALQLPSPWGASIELSGTKLTKTDYRASEIATALAPMPHILSRSNDQISQSSQQSVLSDSDFEFSDNFKVSLKELGVMSYFGLVLPRQISSNEE